jgi:predicted small integral membrane protein
MEWMAWTTPTALVFIGIGLMIAGMTVWELRCPSIARRGGLPMATTRGDRLFIGLVLVVVVHFLWAGATDLPVTWAALPAVALMGLVMWRG